MMALFRDISENNELINNGLGWSETSVKKIGELYILLNMFLTETVRNDTSSIYSALKSKGVSHPERKYVLLTKLFSHQFVIDKENQMVLSEKGKKLLELISEIL